MALDANIISRSNLSGLIPEPVAREIIQGVTEGSAVLSMGRRLPNMSSKTQTLNVLDSLPIAYFVDGDAGAKKTTNMAWDKKKIYAEEIAVIVPIPEAVLDDSDYDIWGEVKPRITEAFGKVIDAAILFGTNKPSSWRAGLVPSAVTAGNYVTMDPTDPTIYNDIMGVDGLIAKVEESGFLPTGAMSAVQMRARLRGLVDTTGQPIFKTDMQGKSPYALDGVPMTFPMNGAFDPTKALMIVGDFAQLTYAIRQDISFKIFTEGVVQNTDGTIAYNLMQNDMVALRAVMRLGWEIPNPISAYNAGNANRFPFAVYQSSANPLDGVTVNAEDGGTSMWGTSVSDMQTSVAVAGNAVTGTLKYLSSGQLVTDWGAGNFLALKWTDIPEGTTSLKVGLVPSAGSGLIEAIDDPDHNGVFKITNKDTQRFVVETSDGLYTKKQSFSLSGLTVQGA